MNLFLIPASNEEADSNVHKTLACPVSGERAEAAGIGGDQRVWGTRLGNRRIFEAMQPGDYCLFYTRIHRNPNRKAFCFLAKIARSEISEKMSVAFWDSKEFPLLYFLRDVRKISLTTREVDEALGQAGGLPYPLLRLTRRTCSPQTEAWLKAI